MVKHILLCYFRQFWKWEGGYLSLFLWFFFSYVYQIEYHKNEEEAPRLAREKSLKEAKSRKEEEKKRKAEREARLAKKKEEEAKKKAPPIREWDRDKIRQSEEKEEPQRKRRPSSESPVKDRRRRERSREKERERDRPIKKEKAGLFLGD